MTKIKRAHKFVSDHRVAIAVTMTNAVWITLTVRNAKELNRFLEKHNLLSEYYDPNR